MAPARPVVVLRLAAAEVGIPLRTDLPDVQAGSPELLHGDARQWLDVRVGEGVDHEARSRPCLGREYECSAEERAGRLPLLCHAHSGTFTLHWKQTGARLSGTIALSRPRGTHDISGSVHGSGIKFGAVDFGATYTGSVSGKSMSGSYRSPQGGGTWSAHKTS